MTIYVTTRRSVFKCPLIFLINNLINKTIKDCLRNKRAIGVKGQREGGTLRATPAK